jgi:hypothetical protein
MTTSPSGTAGSNSTNDAFSMRGAGTGGVYQLMAALGAVVVGMAML